MTIETNGPNWSEQSRGTNRQTGEQIDHFHNGDQI